MQLCRELNKNRKPAMGTATFTVSATRRLNGQEIPGPFYTQLKLIKFEVSGEVSSDASDSGQEDSDASDQEHFSEPVVVVSQLNGNAGSSSCSDSDDSSKENSDPDRTEVARTVIQGLVDHRVEDPVEARPVHSPLIAHM